MVETCIILIITYAGATRNPTKKQEAVLDRILYTIIKIILMVPLTTPREPLYIETGLIDIKHITMRNRINMEKRINLQPNSITYLNKENGANKGWQSITNAIKEKAGVSIENMQGSRDQVKRIVETKIRTAMKNALNKEGENKSKVQHLIQNKQEPWTPGTSTEYMRRLTRNQASTIFKARTRMLKVKNNFRKMSETNTCRMCNKECETQQHILKECPEIHKDESTKTPLTEIFSQDIPTLKKASQKIKETMDKLENKSKL